MEQEEARPSLKIVYLAASLFFLLGLGTTISSVYEPWFPYVWRPFFLVAVVTLSYLSLVRLTSRYRINPLNASVTRGIFSQSTQTAPLNRITNIELRRPFLKRILGLADLMIDTPVSDEIEIQMTEMELNDAVYFKQKVTELLGRQKIVEAGSDATLKAEREAALKISMKSDL